jgi:tetratricopeptide (TPR) repeat protein
MLSNQNPKSLLFGISFLLVLVGPVPLWSPTSQNQNSSIRSQQDLALALLKTQTERPDNVARLLEDHSNLLSQTFWQEIIFAAARNYHQAQHDRAFLIYDIARQVAVKLNDQKLVAKTNYDVGRSYSGLNQFDKAKAAYMESQKAFAAAGLQRDLIYILSDLGTLSLIQEDYLAARTYSEESLKLAPEN